MFIQRVTAESIAVTTSAETMEIKATGLKMAKEK